MGGGCSFAISFRTLVVLSAFKVVWETAPNPKHIDVPHHGLREGVASGGIEIPHVRSAEQHGDYLVKTLQISCFSVCSSIVWGVWWAGTGRL